MDVIDDVDVRNKEFEVRAKSDIKGCLNSEARMAAWRGR